MKNFSKIIKQRGGNKIHKNAQHLHNHETLVNEETGRLYHPGCMTCESNIKFIQAITKDDCSQEEYDETLNEYRRKEANKR